jgi:PAS domain S-box-containing protein
MFSKLLTRQIKKHLQNQSTSDLEVSLPGIRNFLGAIDAAYGEAEVDRVLMERSLEISSQELLEKNSKIEQESQQQKQTLQTLQSLISELFGYQEFADLDQNPNAKQITQQLENLIKTQQTQQKKIRKLYEQVKKFQQALDNASDHITIVDKNASILYINKSLSEKIGYKLEDVLGKKPFDIWRAPEERNKTLVMWKQILKTKTPHTNELKTINADRKTYIARVHITPILDKNQTISFFLIIEHDITKEKEVENLKNEFISTASHELRTPMTIIKGYISLLQTKQFGELTKKQSELLGRVYRNTDILIALVNDMLDINKLEAQKVDMHYQLISLASIAKDIQTEFMPLFNQKEIKLVVKETPLIKTKVFTDIAYLKRVFTNLLGNAYKFTPQKGVVTIEVTPYLNDNNFITVAIKDSGIGIPKEAQSSIFKKFFQAGNSLGRKMQKGTGLGLPISQSIINTFGGKIWVKSEGGQGSTFYFTLPKKLKNIPKVV